jgi:hypothetical protein
MRGVGALLISLSLGATAQAAPLTFVCHADLAGADVRLSDVADTARLPEPLRAAAGALVLTTLPRGVDHALLASARLSERARALMPALRPWLPDPAGGLVAVDRRAAAEAAPAVRCLTALADIPAGAILRAEDFASSACDHPRTDAFRFLRQDSVIQAARYLARGDETPAVPRAAFAAEAPGQTLYVSAQVGPVTVARAVTAVQPAPAGRGLFVRAGDGSVFAAPAPEEAP